MSTPKKIESNRQLNDFDSRSDALSHRPSRPPDHPEKRNTVEAINDFLKQNSSVPAAPRQCSECGSPMRYIDAYFWLDGADIASVIPLPFCPICQPDVLTALRRKGGQGCFDMDKAS